MAEPCDFPESNHVFDKPVDMNRDQCEPLNVRLMVTWPSGFPCILSCWKLTQEELDEINKTGRIWISILSQGMPPVWITGIKPNMEQIDL